MEWDFCCIEKREKERLIDMPTLKFGPEPKTATERVRDYRQRQADRGACNLSLSLDRETGKMLEDLITIRGGRRSGGKAGAVKAAIRHLHKVSCNVNSLAKRSKNETARNKLLALRRGRA